MRHRRCKPGTVFIYTIVAMAALLGLASLAVDLGRVQLAKTELRRGADAAARYGAAGLNSGSASANAIAVAAQNTVDGSALVLQSGDVQTGTWNSATKVFTASGASINAVQVTAHRTQSRGTGIPLLFAKVLGAGTCDVNATSVAQISSVTVTSIVNGNDDPYLSGMPNGTTASYGGSGTAGDPFQHDTAPANNPANPNVPLGAGTALTFSSTGPGTAYDPSLSYISADGDTSTILTHNGGAEHGIASITTPASALIGVFLDANQPDSTSAPAALNFTSSASRNFTTLSPLLKQPFYIGNGVNSSGTVQSFVAPANATRLYLGTMDGFGWVDNIGSLTVTIAYTKIMMVK